MRRTSILLVACLAASVARAEPLFLSILPAGEDGLLPAAGDAGPHTTDQLAPYRDLVLAVPGLTEADLRRFFKPAPTAAPAAPESVETPRAGVTISRDAFGVAHVAGATRADAMFGAGWVTGRDRLFLADALRHIGRGRFTEFAGNLRGVLGAEGFDRTYHAVAGYSEAELQAQIDAGVARDPVLGPKVRDDALAFVEGLNAYIAAARLDPTRMPREYGALGITLRDWTLTDVAAATVSFVTVIGFGNGGGGEHQSLRLLQALEERQEARRARLLWRDLRSAEDPEAPVSTRRAFPYMQVRARDLDPAAVAVLDPGSFVAADPLRVGGAPAAATLRGVPPGMSNWLAVTGARSVEGAPVLVGGPQTGYFTPQALIEMALQGGGLDVRGALVPGTPYVVLGHTPDYAFTATAGGSDLADVRVERLCDGGDGTVFRGECRPIVRRIETWMSGDTPVTATIERTVHGPVIGRATVGGEPVVVAVERTSFNREVESGGGFVQLNENAARTPEQFRDAMARVNATLNWAWVSRDAVAYFHSGAYPVRAAGVDPDLPSWGTGEWEWEGVLPVTAQPFEVDPRRGFATSWNNKPAPGWRAADRNFGFGPVHRVQMLDVRLAARLRGRRQASVAQAVDAMADAATVDLRGQALLPHALALATGDRRLRDAVALLRDWLRSGAHRVDRDRDGRYDDEAAVALMDEWYPRLWHAVLDPQLDGLYERIPLGPDDRPSNGLGSAYQSGYYGYLSKTLRQALGRRVRGRYRVLRCAGAGSRARCARAVRASLGAAVAALASRFGSAEPAAWRADAAADDIVFSLGGLLPAQRLPWQNRPTFQQVVQVRP